MRDLQKYKGIIPAFYACYEDTGEVSEERTRRFAEYCVAKNVRGLYVGGSSGECIYQSVEERKKTLAAVMSVAKGKVTVIAHVGCNNTLDSVELSRYAASLGVDGVASIPPIYFHLPDYMIERYWLDIAEASGGADFFIYNIPQLAGVSLTASLFKRMIKHENVIGVKNSSMPIQDIQMFKDIVGDKGIVFNGPDEQLLGGLAVGADAGIGGTYGVMIDIYLKIYEYFKAGEMEKAKKLQNAACRIIYKMCSCKGNMYSVIKRILKKRENLELGGVRKPLLDVVSEDEEIIDECVEMIDGTLQSL